MDRHYVRQGVKIKAVALGDGTFAESVSVVDRNDAGSRASGPIHETGRPVGYRAVIANANTDTAIALPDEATGAIVSFLVSGFAAEGRVAFRDAATAIAPLTGTDTLMGYQAPSAVAYTIPDGQSHLHVAGLVAATTVSITWLYRPEVEG